jgi:hypothetical protein
MNCDTAKADLMDYFYQELPPDKRRNFEQHLAGCPACRDEVAALTTTATTLRCWPQEDADLSLRFVAQQTGFSLLRLRWQQLRRFAFAFAGAAALLLVVLSALNFEASYAGGELNIQLSMLPGNGGKQVVSAIPVDSLAAPVTRREFEAWKADSYQFVQAWLETSEQRQSRRIGTSLARLALDIEQQRRQDLQLVGEGIEAFQWRNRRQLQTTNKALQQLLLATQSLPLRRDAGQQQ